MLGYTEQELLRLRLQDVIHPEDLPANLAQCNQLVAEARQLTWQKLTPPEWMEASYEQMKQFEVTGRIGPYEKEYFRKDGSRWWFVFAGASLGDGTIVEFCIDVSARKEAEQALRESEERFRTMAAVLELAPVLVCDMESRIVLWTKGAERLYGFSKEEALGRISHDLFQTEFPEGKAHVDERLRSVGELEGELVHRKRDGEQ